jgi:hypothetical protein
MLSGEYLKLLLFKHDATLFYTCHTRASLSLQHCWVAQSLRTRTAKGPTTRPAIKATMLL